MPRFSDRVLTFSRRAFLSGALGAAANEAFGTCTFASQPPGFSNWVAEFRSRALARGISENTYAKVMNSLEPDMSVFAQFNVQPEFTEQLWQYVNRRCSDWRVITGKERAKQYADLFARIEKDYGVSRYVLLGLWGMESSYGDLIDNHKYMRPVIPALAALAWRDRVGAAIGKRNCSTRSPSSTAAGRSRRT